MRRLPRDFRISPLLPLALCEKLWSFVFEEGEGGELKVATLKSENLPILYDLLPPLPYTPQVILLEPEEFEVHLQGALRQERFETLTEQVSLDEDGAIQKLLDCILEESIRLQASDIHIESTDLGAQIRIRVDSAMQGLFELSAEHFVLLSSSLKLLCSLDIHENRKPQDGRFSRIFSELFYDFRLSTLPTAKGESLVIRILCKSKQDFSLSSLGFTENLNFEIPHGLILITGPTGSGKSTTLYAMLEQLKSIEKKIITLEDPIEYDLELLTQVAICEQYGFGFSEALRHILRQDPDVIMVGEMRDQETLSLALRASLTGHLVLSTLHTNDALSSIERLLDMRAKPYLIASTLHLIIAQRLARRLCPHCKIPSPIPPPPSLQLRSSYQALGCPKCNFKGHKGRILLYEILPISPQIKELIAQEAPKEQLITLLEREGFRPLFAHGIEQVEKGRISLEELMRVAHEI